MTLDVRARPRDPLLTFQFRVRSQPLGSGPIGSGASVYLAGCKSVSGLAMNVASFDVWEGGNNLHRHAHPDKVTWDAITLEQGLALDESLYEWAASARQFAIDGTIVANQPIKRDLFLEIWDLNTGRAGTGSTEPVRIYRVYNAWISKYRALPKVDAMASEVAFETVEFVHDGWTRETTQAPARTPLGRDPNLGETDLARTNPNIRIA